MLVGGRGGLVTLAGDIICGNRSEDDASGLCPSVIKGVWKVAWRRSMMMNGGTGMPSYK